MIEKALRILRSAKTTEGKSQRIHMAEKSPKHARGTANLEAPTSSTMLIVGGAMLRLYERIADQNLLVRKITISANRVIEQTGSRETRYEQLCLFSDDGGERLAEREALEKEKKAQEALLAIQKRYGKNSVLKGISLLEDATARDKNKRIGGP